MNNIINIEDRIEYRVIGKYPGSRFEIGYIIKSYHEDKDKKRTSSWAGQELTCEYLDKFPNLFEKVEDGKKYEERQELLDCIQNFMGFFDTPIARMKMPSDDCETVRKIGRDVMKKYNIDYRGV